MKSAVQLILFGFRRLSKEKPYVKQTMNTVTLPLKRLAQLNQDNPVVLCLTNNVTMDFVANSVLAIGASPIMSRSTDEIDELMQIASACYINTGTLNEASIARNRVAIEAAKSQSKPIILDPVGAGATQLRTATNQQFAPQADIIKGNASEIMALCSDSLGTTKGVDSQHQVSEAEKHAQRLAASHQQVIATTGAIDFICDTQSTHYCHYGHPIMTKVTGMGCALGAVIAAFVANQPKAQYFDATVDAITFYNGCASIVSEQYTDAPVSFKQALLDKLYSSAVTAGKQYA